MALLRAQAPPRGARGRAAKAEALSDEEAIRALFAWAFCWGVDSASMRPRGGGDTVRARGMGLSLLRKEADGSWRFARGINNMTREGPPPAAPAG